MKATMAGWTPTWYSQYRFYLSILVGTCILGTLFGLNYLGPTTDVVLHKHLKGLHESALGSNLKYMETTILQGVDRARGTGPDGQKKFEAPEGAEFWTEEGEEGYVRIVKKTEDEGEGEGEEDKENAEKDSDDSSDEDDKSEDKEDADSDSDSKSKSSSSVQDNKDKGVGGPQQGNDKAQKQAEGTKDAQKNTSRK